MKKTGRPSTGQVKWLPNAKHEERKPCWHVRYTLHGKRTPFKPLDPNIPEHDELAARECARRSLEFMLSGGAVAAGIKETVGEYSRRWLADREGRVNSVRDDRSRTRDHVLPILGPLDARTFTRDDVERLRDDLDVKIVKGRLAWKTAASGKDHDQAP